MLVGDHQVLKVALVLLTFLLIFHIFFFDIEKCNLKFNLSLIKTTLIFFNILSIISGLILFKKYTLVFKIIFSLMVGLMFLLNFTYNLFNLSECPLLIFSLFGITFTLPYVLMIFW